MSEKRCFNCEAKWMNRSISKGMWALGSVAILFIVGCNKGPSRYDVSGTATFDGQPIPLGAIVLNADTQSGNSGPQGRVEIRDGKISTKRGMGTVGGAQWLQLMASDGHMYKDHEGTRQQGKVLFDMIHQKIELPPRDVVLNIRVASTQGNKQPRVEIDIQ